MRKRDYTILYVRVEPRFRKLLKKLAKETGRTMTAALERAIEAEWEKHEESKNMR